ncbi:MAG: sulfatase [Candidatus Eisenbacteria bacterium]
MKPLPTGHGDSSTPDEVRPISPVGLGLLFGAWVGVGEVLSGMLAPASSVTHQYALEAALLYGLCGAGLGVLVALIHAALRRRPPVAVTVAVLTGFFAFLFGAGYANVRYLPEAGAGRSLAVTAVILAAAVPLAIGLGRLIGRADLDRRLGLRRPRRLLGWLSAAFAMALTVAALVPVRGRDIQVTDPGAGLDRNVVFIVIDALRYDHLSLNGYERPTSPQIDRWASEAVVFDQAAAQAPWTKPSTATLLTGLYPSTHGVNSMAGAVPGAVDLLPAMLRRHGYRTAIFTANHFITPTFGFDRGTQHFYGNRPPRLTQLLLGHLLERLGQLVAPAGDALAWLIAAEGVLIRRDVPAGGLSAEGLTRAFWSWLDRAPGERFFAYLHFMEPHAPYDPPEPYDTLFMPDSLIMRPKMIDHPAYNGFLPFAPAPPIAADSLANMVALYDGSIRLADFWVSEIIRDLKRRGLLDRTLIVLTADHGEEFHDHGGWGHGQSLHEELLHVPLMLSGPELEEGRGQRFPHPVRHVDLVPTILEVCGLPASESLAGRSLLPIVRGMEPPLPPRPAFSEVDFGGNSARSLRAGSCKVIHAHQTGRTITLAFDLADDPHEMHDVAAPGVTWLGPMLEGLEEMRAVAAREAVPRVEIEIDEVTRERLRGLGYLK